MSVHSVQNGQSVAQTEAVSQAQSAQKQAKNVLPRDTVTISAAAQAKQTAAIGADGDHDSK